MKKNICAVVVTFHPCEEDIANLGAIRCEVEHAVVVDNGSEATTLAVLRAVCSQLDIDLIENGVNLGIGAALNTGVRRALELQSQWIVLFDQDSTPKPGMVKRLLLAFDNHPQKDKVGIVVPLYVDRRSGLPLRTVRAVGGALIAAQTSGSLMPVAVFEKIGWFDEKFFIDCVDFDYCLRLTTSGGMIEECRDAILLHKPGSLQSHRLFGRELFTTYNYSPTRHYYQTRNSIWLFRKHSRNHFLICTRFVVSNILKIFVKTFDDTNRWAKWRAAICGFADGVFINPNAK